MKRAFCLCFAVLLIIACSSGLLSSFAGEDEGGRIYHIATVDNRPLYIDRLLHTAFKEIGYSSNYDVFTLESGYKLTENGETDGVIAATPDIDEQYENLVRVPFLLDNVNVYVITRDGDDNAYRDWEDLNGVRVGILTNRVYLEERLPSEETTEKRETINTLLEGLSNGSYDAAVLAVREHEVLSLPDNLTVGGVIGQFPEYLYLNSSNKAIIPELTAALRRMESSGLAEAIRNDEKIPDAYPRKTILNVVSGSMDNARDEQFIDIMRAPFLDSEEFEWFALELQTRRYPKDAVRMTYFEQLLRWNCVTRDIAAIIISGDDALDFVKEYYFRFFRNIPVFFYGVNTDYADAVRYFESYITGINETLPILETAEMTLELFPETESFYILCDENTTEGIAYRDAAEEQLANIGIPLRYSTSSDRETLIGELKELDEHTIVLACSFFRDSLGQFYSVAEIGQMLEAYCTAPVFTPYSIYLPYNAIGGKCLDYTSYGEIAVDWIENALEGKLIDVSAIPKNERSIRWVFNNELLTAWGINENALPPGSEIINRAKSLWETEPLFIVSVFALTVVGLIVIAGIFLMQTQRRKRREIQARESWIQELNRSLQTVLDFLPVPVRIVNLEDHTISYMNYAAADLFGYLPGPDLLEKSAHLSMPPQQPDGINSEEHVRNLDLSQGVTSQELVCLKKSGKPFDVLFTVCPIEYQGKKSSLGIMKDLTAEKEYERVLLNTIEREKEANQLKSNFLSNMSHEIRTPMNAIIGLTELELRKDLLSVTRESIKKINTSAKTLLQIINDILDLSKIEADRFVLANAEFDLESVLSNALLVVSPRLDEKSVELLLDADPGLPRFVIGDETRLWQILKNFLDNSAKFTERGKVILRVAADEITDSTVRVCFAVEDTGIGLDNEMLEKIFLPYEQAQNEAQKRYTGTGLGLPIAKNLCEMMGGQLNIESEQGKGTIIRFTIPFGRSQNNDDEPFVRMSRSLEGLRILAADDDSLSLEIIRKSLERNGAQCVCAGSGEEAVRLAEESKETPYDAVLLDYRMKGIDGAETAVRIRKLTPSSHLFLMLTTYQKLHLPGEPACYGQASLLEKPLIPSGFIQRVNVALGLVRENQDGHGDTFIRFRNARALICEDNEINQEVASGMLDQFGVETVIAENGRLGVEKLRADGPFDIVFMDLHMPIMGGFEATRLIRSDPANTNLPVISLSADAMTVITEESIKAGMNDHLSKPVSLHGIYDILMKWLPAEKRVTPAKDTAAGKSD